MRNRYLLTVLISPLVLYSHASWAQQVIKGRVTDAKKSPLPNLTVLVKGTTNGTLTDLNGDYSIPVPDGNSTLD